MNSRRIVRTFAILLLFCNTLFAHQIDGSRLVNAVHELTWATPKLAARYQHTKKLNENLWRAVKAMQKFDPILAMGYASQCHGEALIKRDVALARLCSAVASAFADAAGRPDIGLHWAGQAGVSKGADQPIFDQLDAYLSGNAASVALFKNKKLEPIEYAPSLPPVVYLKMHPVMLPVGSDDKSQVRLPAIVAEKGSKKVHFLLDSGAPSFISTSSANVLGFSSFGWRINVGTLDQCTAYLERGKIAGFDLGALRVPGMELWRSSSSCHEYSSVNVLGFDFFYRVRRLFIDYENDVVGIGSGLTKGEVGMSGGTCIRLGFRFSPILVEGNVSLPGSVRGEMVSVMPDLGNSIGVLISPSAYKRLLLQGVIEPGKSSDKTVSLPLTLGDRAFLVNAIVRPNPVGIDVVLPYSFFTKWFFDYDDGILCGER
ncbi:hypothetical protein [Dyella ginsengisoli]|uniref:hypothetical protein n=1 Tax=Dyella ginsengisoli TaxID=363848 RepID=UPI0012FE59DA|nr:hypothetical protein [Dyella ginsengisoli]